jgi:hypothetical protein
MLPPDLTATASIATIYDANSNDNFIGDSVSLDGPTGDSQVNCLEVRSYFYQGIGQTPQLDMTEIHPLPCKPTSRAAIELPAAGPVRFTCRGSFGTCRAAVRLRSPKGPFLQAARPYERSSTFSGFPFPPLTFPKIRADYVLFFSSMQCGMNWRKPMTYKSLARTFGRSTLAHSCRLRARADAFLIASAPSHLTLNSYSAARSLAFAKLSLSGSDPTRKY